jgi:hypothetical protein
MLDSAFLGSEKNSGEKNFGSVPKKFVAKSMWVLYIILYTLKSHISNTLPIQANGPIPNRSETFSDVSVV